MRALKLFAVCFLRKISNRSCVSVVENRHFSIMIPASNTAQVKEIWRQADGVCFDVDSTLIQDEGIDELAEFCGAGEQVKAWTAKAMSGGISFREALDARLRIINPTQERWSEFIKSHPPRFSPGVQDLIQLLHSRNKKIFLVSGGFVDFIKPIARAVNIPEENIYAIKLFFDPNDGHYTGFDKTAPTSDSGGKAAALRTIKDKYKLNSLVMIGDGITDSEASPPADAFIGYGGNVMREQVKAKAKWYVTNFEELINELKTS